MQDKVSAARFLCCRRKRRQTFPGTDPVSSEDEAREAKGFLARMYKRSYNTEK
jgi:hypothetical protein